MARSIHPTHSVAGRGPNAAILLSRHHLDVKPVSADSPYGLLRDYETYILLLGVALESCTAIHLPEETINPDLYLLPTVESYPCRDRHGTVHEVRTLRHRRLPRNFPRFGPPLEARKLLARGVLGDCPYMVVSMRHLLVSVVLVLLVFAVVQVIQDAILTPRIMGKTTGLRPVAILLGVFIWGKLLGFLGLLLAIPLTCLGVAYYQRVVLGREDAQPPPGDSPG